MNALLRHPLLHFLALGALVFVLDDWLRPESDRPIVVNQALINTMQRDLQRRGDSDEASLERAIDSHIEEAILVREARRLGLDQGDPIVRRRLAQVMRFFLAETHQPREPSQAELEAHLQTHAERYRQPARVSFEHHFFQGAQAEERCQKAALALAAKEPIKGDAFAHGQRMTAQSQIRLEQRFGPGFAARVMTLEAQPTWVKLKSAFGLHLVRLSAKQPAGIPPFETVASALRKDWLRTQNKRQVSEALMRLKARYVVERP